MSDSRQKPKHDAQLEELVAHACDGILSDDESPVLGGRLARDEKARGVYLEAMAVEGLLHAEHAESLLTAALSEQSHALSHKSPATAIVDALSASLWPRDARLLWTMVTVAASLLIAVTGLHAWTWAFNDTSVMVAQRATMADGRPVGRITATHSAQWANVLGKPAEMLVGGQRLKLDSGVANLRLDRGVVVTVEGPADLEIVSGGLLLANRGTLKASAGSAAEGFVIQTPSAQVVQVGPDAGPGSLNAGVGVDIDEYGGTDVVVFDGQVALQYAKGSVYGPRQRRGYRAISFRDPRRVRRVSVGEALHVDLTGQVRQIEASDAQTLHDLQGEILHTSEAVISAVRVESDGPGDSRFYPVAHGAFDEDARAFVDRFHEWNGMSGDGLPQELVGADYVMTANADKWAIDFTLHIDLASAATLYVFLDNRVDTPAWVAERFEDTGWDIGLDEGWLGPDRRAHTLSRTGSLAPLPDRIAGAAWPGRASGTPSVGSADATQRGPGRSVDADYSVWRLTVPRATRVTLGPPGVGNEHTGMYGIAATPE